MNETLLRKITLSFIVVYISLCLLHYFSQRPLWLDEGFVYQSLTTYSYEKIFGPLKTQQAFPRVYLACIKFISENFQYNLLAVRFLSLVAMVAAFLGWVRIYRRTIQSPFMFLLTLGGFCVSYRLVYYGAELKHYSMDVLTVTLYLLFFFLQAEYKNKQHTRWLWLGSIFLPFTLFFAYSSLFVCWISVLNFLLMSCSDKNVRKFFWINLMSTVLCAGTFYFIDLRYSFRQSGILQYWDSYFVLTDSVEHFFGSIFEGVKRIVTYWAGTEKWQYRLAVPFMPFYLYAIFRYGIKYLKEDQGKVLRVEALALVLLIELFILGLFKYYPFTGERITLFLAPFVFYLILKGIQDLKEVKGVGKKLSLAMVGYYAIYFLMCLINAFTIFIKLY